MQIPLSLRRIRVFGKLPFVRLQQILSNPIVLVHLFFKNFFYKRMLSQYDHKYSQFVFLTPQETLERLIRNNLSLSRYGDGEFEQICGYGEYPSNSDWEQKNSKKLIYQLKDVLSSPRPELLIAVPPKYTFLKIENMPVRHKFPLSMRLDVTRLMWRYLDHHSVYGDSHLFVPADSKDFDWGMLKSYFSKYDIIIATGGIENLKKFSLGKKTYFVECGKINAYERKEEIKKDIRSVFTGNNLDKENTIVLASLGPTATILAFEFIDEGIWLWDTGHMFKYAASEIE